ncbi:hypothetical protein AX17_007257 [Amanita inopinata Kibby_2008]|nr:hypothetical protein AX17_007257 [Amanita inopinata Kibby_2008]
MLNSAMVSFEGISLTPTRTRERLPFPQSAQPSPAPQQRTASSLPSTAVNPPNLHSSSVSSRPLTPETLLKTHSAASDPKLAALEQAINERNSLSAQNIQLWKLIEKQRTGYSQILKELERIRAERDAYKAKLGIGGSSIKRDRTHKQSITQQVVPSDDYQSSEGCVSPLTAQAVASTAVKTLSSFSVVQPHSEPFTTMVQDIARQSQTKDNASMNGSSTMNSISTSDIRRLSGSAQASALSFPNALPVAPYNSSNSTPEFQVDLSASANPPYIPSSPWHSRSAGIPTRSPHRSSTSTITLPSQSNLSYEDRSSSPQAASTESNPSPSDALLNPRSHLSLSRLSCESLPDEAKQYIANMPDSPLPSPHEDAVALPLMQKASFASNTGGSANVVISSTAISDESRQIEFLDMDDEDEDVEADFNGDTASVDSEHGTSPFVDTSQTLQSSSASETSLAHRSRAIDRRGKKGRAHAAVDDFPLPPSTINLYTQQGTIKQEGSSHLNHISRATRQAPFVSPAVAYNQHDSNTRKQNTLQSESQVVMNFDQISSPDVKSRSPQATTHFRALPLLSTDLPTTTVTVSHSFVRPNDRGKEVLSFVVHVNPGNGKPGWKVEKMYSDVLGLDHRVRNSVGKGIGKKIANLPEGKLWKDHAPAKVDQRKAVLEHYLQTLINLPVRNNDEVIAFFTTDIVREAKQPVMQIGHKEGYLTKRGKNFGGWKTRYFVLQGPILEYYDCRGGTHLGSIAITGAQIGRQQRSDRPGADDDNEYRHAFLIVEAKRGPGGNHPRHVLCAESDEDRDSWVEILVRYFTGTYSEDPLPINPALNTAHSSLLPRTSASSTDSPQTPVSRSRGPTRAFSRDEISVSKGPAIPISQLAPDPSNAKFFQTGSVNLEDSVARSSSPTKSLDHSLNESERQSTSDIQQHNALKVSETAIGLPSSLPEQSILSNPSTTRTASDSAANSTLLLRANSELGHYPDLQQQSTLAVLKSPRRTSPEKYRSSTREHDHKSYHPSGPALPSSATMDRVPSPDKLDTSGRVKISGPMNGAPIPSGFKFGGHSDVTATPTDRREKAKSRSFWGFGKANGDKQVIVHTSRSVFGVPLEESLEVAQICNLPAIVFRAIQYLEAKDAEQEEGIYRLSGSSAVIKSLKDRFNLEGDVDLLASDEFWDPHAIAGLLKSYLRDLPASILTRELHLRFLAVIDLVDSQERIKELSQLIAALPLANYTLLRALTAHLILIVQNSATNKMTMRNVGIVFSPTLGIPAGVFSLMLGEFNRVFNVDADIGDTNEVDASSEHSSELYRRNSRRYSEAAADQLLGLSGRSLKAAPDDEAQSDEDSDGESEMTDGDMTVESISSSGINAIYHEQASRTPPDTPTAPTAPKTSKASHVAASRGLNLNVTQPERGNRYSRMMGLPTSPRPPYSPQHSTDAFPPPKLPTS